jgi:PAS domain S-box-containing protein
MKLRTSPSGKPVKKTAMPLEPEQQLALLNINTEEPFVMVSLDFTIMMFNKQFEYQYRRFFGKEVQQGDSILNYTREGQAEHAKKIYQQVFSGISFQSEMEAKAPEGTQHFFMLHFKPAFNERGKIIGAFVSSADISEIKKSASLLNASENRFRALIEKSTDGTAIVTREGKPVYLSPSIEKLLGYTEEEILKQEVFSTLHPDDISGIQDLLLKCSNHPGMTFSGKPIRALHRNGTWQWFEFTVTNMLHNPHIKGIICNFRNITEKVQAEKEKEFDRSNMEALINNTNDMMWSISKDGKLITSNRAFDEIILLMTGHPVVKGGDAPSVGFSEEQLKAWEGYYNRAFSGETFTIIEHAEAPVQIWSEISFYPIRNGDEIIGTACYTRNITERKLFERQLEQNTADLIHIKQNLEHSENNLKESQKIANLGSWSFDLSTNHTHWSDQAYKIFGTNQQDIQPSLEKFMSFIHPADLDAAKKIIEEGTQKLVGYSFDCRIIRTDGVVRHLYSDCNFKLDENGRPYELHGNMHDITERKNAETWMLHSESRLKQSQELAHIGHWEVNFATGVSRWSDEAYRIYGLEPAEYALSFEEWRTFVHPEDLPEFEVEMKRASDTLSHSIYGHRIVRKDGTVRHVISESRFEFDGMGKPTGLYGIVQDVTEKKLADEEIRVAKERYDLVTKATNDAIYDWDLITNTIIRTGDGLKVLFGYEPEQTKRADFWSSKMHPEDRDWAYAKLNDFIENQDKQVCDMEYRLMKADGSYAHVYDKGYIVRDTQGKAVRMIGATQDISHRKSTELLLKELNERLEKRAQELVRSNAELEQFAYIASHDLQEPLRMVTSFLMQLEKKYKEQLDDKAKKYIYFATDGATRMRRIILDLLEYSRVGRQTMDKTEVDTNNLIQETIQLNKAVIDEKNAIIEWKDLPVITGHETVLQQVFQNLISNSLKYQKEGVRPVIKIEVTDIDTHWQFAVSDNGIGIEPQYSEKIFVVFQRLHNKDEYSGTGIGLAICKKIVENHNGRIWVESSPGSGSTFYFTISKNQLTPIN